MPQLAIRSTEAAAYLTYLLHSKQKRGNVKLPNYLIVIVKPAPQPIHEVRLKYSTFVYRLSVGQEEVDSHGSEARALIIARNIIKENNEYKNVTQS